jgi:SOS response regulatory protein OraA/RecX
MAYQDRTHQEYAREAHTTGAAEVAQATYRRLTGTMSEEDIADRILSTLRRRGYSYGLSAHLAWQYS